MAGDWIKMRMDLGDDPAVVLIAGACDLTEDEVVGKLHRLWCWADRHTTDGAAPAITPKWVDRYVGHTGFAEAMQRACWLNFTDSGVIFPNFDKHNGKSAKRRAENTIKQRLSRANRDKGMTGVTRMSIPRPFIRHVMMRDNYTCVFCGAQSNAKTESGRWAILSVDHLTPESRGGSTAVENLACACRQCNNEKNDRTPEEWGCVPTFLQPGVMYKGGILVTDVSLEMSDESVTREEKRRVKETPLPPSGFVRFWNTWPPSSRKGAKGKCEAVWKRAGLESQADEILKHVESMKRSADWQKEGGAFVPAPLVYLNQRRWEGATEQTSRFAGVLCG